MRHLVTPLPKKTVDKSLKGVLNGEGASPGTYEGPVRIIRSQSDFSKLQNGDVLIIQDMEPILMSLFHKAKGLVVVGTHGILQHAGITARNFGIPAVVNVKKAFESLRDGQIVRLDGLNGTVTIVEHE